MRLPPGVSTRNDAWPSQVSVPAMRPRLTKKDRPTRERMCGRAGRGALVADGQQPRTVALYFVLAAIPAVAVATLAFFGDLVEGSADAEAGAVYVGLSTLALVLLLIGAAVRENTL